VRSFRRACLSHYANDKSDYAPPFLDNRYETPYTFGASHHGGEAGSLAPDGGTFLWRLA